MYSPLPIFPAPREMIDGEGRFEFGSRLEARVPEGELSPRTRELLSEIFHMHCQTACTLSFREVPGQAAHTALLGAPSLEGDLPEAEEAYSVQVTPLGVRLCSGSQRGLLYAFYTWMQCIFYTCLREGEERFYCESGLIRDCPALSRRGIHLCLFPRYYPLVKKALRLAAYLKMNYVILEFWGTYPFKALDSLHWKDASLSREQVQELIDTARALGMELIPMYNHWGHAPMSRGRVGKHVTLDQNPRHALLYEPDGWTWCLSNPDTHRLLRAVREELMELCGPGKYFHLGCDEASPFGSCPACRKLDFMQYIPGYLNGLAEELEREGRRAIVWADQYLESGAWPEPIYGTSTREYPTHGMLDSLDRRIILADWQYRMDRPELPSSEYFIRKGFDVWPAAFDDAPSNFEMIARAADRIGAYGYLATTWNHLPSLLQRMPEICASAWCGQRYTRHPEQGILAYTLLRRVMPLAGGYEEAGYLPAEADARGYRVIM